MSAFVLTHLVTHWPSVPTKLVTTIARIVPQVLVTVDSINKLWPGYVGSPYIFYDNAPFDWNVTRGGCYPAAATTTITSSSSTTSSSSSSGGATETTGATETSSQQSSSDETSSSSVGSNQESQDGSEEQGNTLVIGIGAGVGALVVILLIVAVAVFLVKGRGKKRYEHPQLQLICQCWYQRSWQGTRLRWLGWWQMVGWWLSHVKDLQLIGVFWR